MSEHAFDADHDCPGCRAIAEVGRKIGQAIAGHDPESASRAMILMLAAMCADGSTLPLKAARELGVDLKTETRSAMKARESGTRPPVVSVRHGQVH